MYYYEHYGGYVEAQNARNEKTRHTERNRTVEDLLKNNKTCPEESIYQIGTLEESVPPETLFRGTSLTVRTATGNCAPSRKRRWKNWASLSLTRRSPKAGTTIASRPLMRSAGRSCLTSPDGMGCIWIRSRPTAGGTIWKNRIIS